MQQMKYVKQRVLDLIHEQIRDYERDIIKDAELVKQEIAEENENI